MQDSPEPTTPTPRRFWWLKRLSLAVLVLAVLLAGLRLVWGQSVQAKLDAAIADIHAKNEPILFEDLKHEALIDVDNGAAYLEQAHNGWPNIGNGALLRIIDTDWYNEGEEAGFTDPITDNAAYLASCEPVFDLLRQADQVEHASRKLPPSRPLFNMSLSNLGNLLSLARLINDAGDRALETGDIALVFEITHHLHTVARHTHVQNPFLIDSLVAISIMEMNREFIESALPKIDPADLRQGRARELAEETISRLVDGMLGEGLINSFVGERAASYDIYACLLDGTVSANYLLGMGDPIEWMIDTPGLSYAYRPALINAQYTSTQIYTSVIDALRNRVGFANIPIIDPAFEEELYSQPLKYPLLTYLLPAYGSAIRTYYRSDALLQCTAVAIAIKLYEADHGKRPDNLAQLVPGYLPAIPIDPFSNTGEPIRYNPQGVIPGVLDELFMSDEQREKLLQLKLGPYPVLYSVGEDGTDDGGGPLLLDRHGTLGNFDRFNRDGGDIWFMLDAMPEATFTDDDLNLDAFGLPKSEDEDSEAGDDEVDVQGDQGQDAEDQPGEDHP